MRPAISTRTFGAFLSVRWSRMMTSYAPRIALVLAASSTSARWAGVTAASPPSESISLDYA